MTTKPLAGSCLLALPLFSVAFAAESPPVTAGAAPPYPEVFLQWPQLKATTFDPKDPATARLTDAHFVYANALAVEGLRTGKYPEGAVFVQDIFNVIKEGGPVKLGERESTSSMVRDPRAA